MDRVKKELLPRFHVRFGSKADIDAHLSDVRFTPESGHQSPQSACPLSARSGLPLRNKERRYSINSSAATSMVFGTTSPSALAVLRLMTSSNFVGC